MRASIGTNHTRHRWLGLAVALVLAALVLPANAGATVPGALSATLDGRLIAPNQVARYDCHDRDYPVIRCFRTASELAADEQTPGSATASASPLLVGAFVRFYQDAYYGGSYFDAYNAYADLSPIGWNDIISSFTPLNGGHPLWWQNANYSGVMWDWGTAAEPTLGNANDQISSVAKR